MASIFQAAGRPNWQIAWVDSSGKRHVRSSGTSEKRAAEKMAEKFETDAALEREGLRDPRDDAFKLGARTPLTEHVTAFCDYLANKGDCAKHVDDRRSQLARLVAVMGVDKVAQLTVGRVQAGLAKLRQQRGISLRTLDRHLRAIKGLTRWLTREGLIPSDPLFGLASFNCAADRRLERRALPPEEIALLVRAAESGPVCRGLSGPDRAALYRLAVGTGFRASELASLTPESFRLDESPPKVVVKAAYSKNRRESQQPIRPDLAATLRPWLATKKPGAPVFAIKVLRYNAAAMMRHDLAAAGIPFEHEGKVVDFHALRHTYVTQLVLGGAPIAQVQKLARHSTPVLTLAVYTHAAMKDLTAALDALPETVGTASRCAST